MRLVQTVPDETMIVPGFEHHILNCPCCHDEERRLVFIRQPEPFAPPIETDEIDRDFLDATLQPVGEAAAADGAPQESRSVGSAGMLPIESMHLPLASPAYRFSISRNARAATSSVWGRTAARHRERWRALCAHLGLRIARKAGVSREE
jgi:hypothetical protein